MSENEEIVKNELETTVVLFKSFFKIIKHLEIPKYTENELWVQLKAKHKEPFFHKRLVKVLLLSKIDILL